MKIVTLGPAGTFSHEAALSLFEDADIELAPNLDSVFRIAEEKDKVGFVPFENSLHGSVDEVLDLLVNTPVHIWMMHDTNVHHALGATNPSQIRMIASHPQALAQCRTYLKEKYPNAERFPVSSTAYAIDLAIEDETTAAIASQKAMEEHGLPIVDNKICRRSN